MIITNPANERLKHARRVRDGREPDLLFIEGERLVAECLAAGLPLAACFHSPTPTARAQTLIAALARRGCPLHPTADAALAATGDTVNTQGIIVLAQRPVWKLEQALAGAAPLLVGLDGVQDPGNFGTLVRTAEAAGARGLIALTGSVDAFAPKTLRAAMGSAFRLPIVVDAAADEVLAAAHSAGLTVAATAGDAATNYLAYDWRRPTLVVFGNEARGVGEKLKDNCDVRLRIPLHPPVESLNVAAAAAAMLFEAARQRG